MSALLVPDCEHAPDISVPVPNGLVVEQNNLAFEYEGVPELAVAVIVMVWLTSAGDGVILGVDTAGARFTVKALAYELDSHELSFISTTSILKQYDPEDGMVVVQAMAELSIPLREHEPTGEKVPELDGLSYRVAQLQLPAPPLAVVDTVTD